MRGLISGLAIVLAFSVMATSNVEAFADPDVAGIWLFDEDTLRQAIFTLIDQEQLVVEASGAIAIAPLLNDTHNLKDQTIVCILTGANIDSRLLANILSQNAN